MVNCEDIVPRISKASIKNLAVGAKAFSESRESPLSRWWKEDADDVQKYVKSIGERKGMRPNPTDSEPTKTDQVSTTKADLQAVPDIEASVSSESLFRGCQT